jgi:diaminopimelate epimerase
MIISFIKYQGAGNDFIMIDDRSVSFDTTNNELISKLCSRKTGVGADGLILLRSHPKLDFEMIYFNADGFLGSMCGNGGRCVVDFAHHLGIINDDCMFMAVDGFHHAERNADVVSLEMADVNEIENIGQDFFLDTGSPHYVKMVSSLKDYDVYQNGKDIRYSSKFEEDGTNVNFVSLEKNVLHIRTYERGVEDETLACGTGTVASVIALHHQGLLTFTPVKVKALGGDLSVSFQKEGDSYKNIYLTGQAQAVFKGEISC